MSKARSRKRTLRMAKRDARRKAEAWTAKRAVWLKRQAAQEPKAARSTPRKSLLLQFRLRPVETLKKFSVLYLAAFGRSAEGKKPDVQFRVTQSFPLGMNTTNPLIGGVNLTGSSIGDLTGDSVSQVSAMHLYSDALGSHEMRNATVDIVGDSIDVGTSPPYDSTTIVAREDDDPYTVSIISYGCEEAKCFAAWSKEHTAAGSVGTISVRRMDKNFQPNGGVDMSVATPETPDCPSQLPLDETSLHNGDMSVGSDVLVITFQEGMERANATYRCEIDRNRVVVLDKGTLREKYSGTVEEYKGSVVGLKYSKSLGVPLENQEMVLLTFKDVPSARGQGSTSLIFDLRRTNGSRISRYEALFEDHPKIGDFAVDYNKQANAIGVAYQVEQPTGSTVVKFRQFSLNGQPASSPVVIAQSEEVIDKIAIHRVAKDAAGNGLKEGDRMVTWTAHTHNDASQTGTGRVQIVRDSKPLGDPMVIQPVQEKGCIISDLDLKSGGKGFVAGIGEECKSPPGKGTDYKYKTRVEVVEVAISDASTTGDKTTGDDTTGKDTTGDDKTTGKAVTTGKAAAAAEVSASQSQPGLSAGAVAGIATATVAGAAALVTCGIFAVKKLSALPVRYRELADMADSDAALSDTTPLLQRLAAVFRR